MRNTAEAYNLAVEFAQELNADPEEAQKWHFMDPSDPIPDGDYAYLENVYGEMHPDYEAAYREGFNSQFKPVEL